MRPNRKLLDLIGVELPIIQAPLAGTTGSAIAACEAAGLGDSSSLWSGQAAILGCEMDAGELTRKLAEDAAQRLVALASPG